MKQGMLKTFREAQARGDIAEMGLRLDRLEAADAIAESINDIRIRMLRSMAEQNREYSKDNVTKLFPKVLPTSIICWPRSPIRSGAR